MLITSPITNEAASHIANYARDKHEYVKIFIDIQNISAGKYYHDVALDAYLTQDEKELVSSIYSELCYLLSQKVIQFANQGLSNVYILLYLDTKRNILNEYFIPTWKKNRTKEWLNLFDKDKSKYEALSWLGKVYDVAITSFRHLINTSPRCRLVVLEYLDSDFVPKLFMMLDNYLGLNDKTLYVIVANDYDYVHLLDEHENCVLYIHTDKKLNIVNKYNLYKRIAKRFAQKSLTDDDRKLIGKYYCVFHSLIGDNSDGFSSIQKGKSIVYWYQKLKEKLDCYEGLRQLRSCIFDNPLSLETNVFDIFIKRLQVVDFYFFSNWLLGCFANEYHKLSLTDYDKHLFSISYSKLPLNCRNIVKHNLNNIVSVLSQDTVINAQEAKKVLESFNVHKADYYAQILWE